MCTDNKQVNIGSIPVKEYCLFAIGFCFNCPEYGKYRNCEEEVKNGL